MNDDKVWIIDGTHIFLINKEENQYFRNKDVLNVAHSYRKYNEYLQSDSLVIPYKIHGIGELGICLTNNCNFRCNYCMDAAIDGKKDYLKISDIISFIEKGIEYWSINKIIEGNNKPFQIYFTGGGEQTYNWELFRDTVIAIKDISYKNNVPVELGLTTNGYLSPQQVEFLNQNFSKIMVSYDGLPSIQNTNRQTKNGSETNKVVENTIESLLREDTVKLTCRTTVWPDDMRQFIQMYDYLGSRFSGNFIWELHPVILRGRAKATVENRQTFSSVNFIDEYLKLLDYARKKLYTIEITQSVLPTKLRNISCGACSPFCNVLWLIPGNKIVTCIESFDNVTQIGTVDNGKVIIAKDINDPLLKTCISKQVECQDCIAFPFCRGGCPLRQMDHTIKPQCDMIQKFWKRNIEQMLQGNSQFGWSLKEAVHHNLKCYRLESVN